MLLQFATARIGVILVTINPAYRAAELEYTLAQSEVRGLALIERYRSNAYFDLLREVCPELDTARPGELHSAKFPHLQWVVRIRGAEHPGMLAWQDLEAAGERFPPRGWRKPNGNSDRAIRSTCNTRPERPAFPRGRCSATATCC